jgi:chloramphenicol 3-O-phosphotransferase
MSLGSIILISGPPGAGKSTVAKELAGLLDGPVASIEGDVFWQFIVKSKGSQRKIGRSTNSRLVIKAMMYSALVYARGGYTALVDFTIGPWFFDLFEKHLEGTPFHYVVLCPSEAVCAQRAVSRAEGAMADYSEFRELHAAFSDAQGFDRHVVRNGDAGAAELAQRILAEIAADGYRIS